MQQVDALRRKTSKYLGVEGPFAASQEFSSIGSDEVYETLDLTSMVQLQAFLDMKSTKYQGFSVLRRVEEVVTLLLDNRTNILTAFEILGHLSTYL